MLDILIYGYKIHCHLTGEEPTKRGLLEFIKLGKEG